MNRSRNYFILGFSLFALGLGLYLLREEIPQAQAEEKPAAASKSAASSVAGLMPVEGDMHEFMEYVFEPPYKRLREVFAAETLDNKAFKSVKSDGLILAEAGNLLLIRVPKEDGAAWREHAIQVREFGATLYKAGKSKDADASRKSFAGLLLKCNACHDQFADGEHQLSP